MRSWQSPGLTSAWRVLLLSSICALTSPVLAADDQQQRVAGANNAPLSVPAPEPAIAAEPVEQALAPGGRREDLTVFFAIGILIDLLLLTLFFVWATRQWRNTRR
ncbi:MAG: hypothetical protein RQ736_00640 [Thiogranum sp.]|nr:hypothetical protein [Thiogranum sp.]